MAHVGLLEDNIRIARLCATMLQYAGHHVVIYSHPRECLRALLPSLATCDSRQQGYKLLVPATQPLDVLILDLHLPDMDGLEVIHYLREHSHTRSLPLIFCTAAPLSEVAKALDIAPDASFVEKPFSFQELTAAIMSALKETA